MYTLFLAFVRNIAGNTDQTPTLRGKFIIGRRLAFFDSQARDELSAFSHTNGQILAAGSLFFGRRNRAGALRDEAVMLDPAVGVKIKYRLADIFSAVEIALGNNDFVPFGHRLDDHFSGRRYDAAAAHMMHTLFHSGLGAGQHPGAILVSAGLHGEMIVEHTQMR